MKQRIVMITATQGRINHQEGVSSFDPRDDPAVQQQIGDGTIVSITVNPWAAGTLYLLVNYYDE